MNKIRTPLLNKFNVYINSNQNKILIKNLALQEFHKTQFDH